MASSPVLTSLILFGQPGNPAERIGLWVGIFLGLIVGVLLFWKGFGGKKKE